MKNAVRRSSVLLGFLFLVAGQYAWAGTPEAGTDEVPKIIVSGFEAYKAQGPDAALKAWLKGSALEGSREILSQANNLRQIQDFYGAYKNFHVITTKNLTPTTRVIYVEIDFDKGPLFAKFTTFRSGSDWILVNFDFNTKAEMILPNCP